LEGNPEKRRQLGRRRHRWEDTRNNNVDLRELGWYGMGWIYVPKDRE
jgi:hypothetical protein